MEKIFIPKNLSKKERLKFISDNEALIFHAKKSQIKNAPGCSHSTFFIDEKGVIIDKAEGSGNALKLEWLNSIDISVVINTTNYLDSHGDVHIPGIWDKSLKDNKKNGFYLLGNHGRKFEDVIGEGLKGSVSNISWKDLGFPFIGTTQALLFTGKINKDRNEYMFGQYAKGYVKQHSVGMQYVKMLTCINDDDYPVQKENWDKYYPMVMNKDDADKDGYFWSVLEAKIVEGSAVLFGSNDLTPVFAIEESKNDESTMIQPGESTVEQPQEQSFTEYLKQTKFINI
jgi:hypothetical protein